MAAQEYGFTLTPGGSSRARSLTIACAAIAAVCVLSSTVVMRELIGGQAARAAIVPTIIPTVPAKPTAPVAAPASTARTWALEPRWWAGDNRQVKRQAPTPTVADNELTFTKGYQLRLATRQMTQPAVQSPSAPAQVATSGPAADNQSGRIAVRKPPTVAPAIAHTETPDIRRISVTPDPFAPFSTPHRALAYDEQRPSERGVVEYRRAPNRSFFGTLY